MKFGKQIQAQQVPGWSVYYLDYKFLKKIISSLAANRPASEAAALALGVRPHYTLSHSSAQPLSQPTRSQTPVTLPSISPGQPPFFPASGYDIGRGPDFQAHKAAFFFKLERELEKINAFYLQKEAELKLRMETLLSKRRAAAMRGFPDTNRDSTQNHVEWSAVEEGFRLLERDLGKLQQFVEINAIGFRKILKKYDKRSTSTTKELYLARQVDVQPVFNRQLISELADTVATCLLDITDLTSGLNFEGPNANDIFTQQILIEQPTSWGPFGDLENNFRKAVAASDPAAIKDCVHYSDVLMQQNGGIVNITRIIWNVIIEAPQDFADLILDSLSSPFTFNFIDDINGRTCLHEAAIAGAYRLVGLCIRNGVQVNKSDLYGRTALHYAAMNGHAEVCRQLLRVNVPPNTLDRDNYSPLVYATLKGNASCVRVLLEEGGVSAQSPTSSGDLSPISLASQAGHQDIVILLLQHHATLLSNSNGEYPMHLAAQKGHAAVCKLLLQLDGWDTPDKYHEWTPMFHAARYGHERCVQVLLDGGARPHLRDELGHLAAHYAAWYGHRDCLSRLLSVMQNISEMSLVRSTSVMSPQFDEVAMESEIDLIPSLSLPPPIMPHRVYGHNYLVNNHLVQVHIGQSSRQNRTESGVRLHHRLISPVFKDEYLLATSPLKLVMTTSSSVNSAPYSVSLPQKPGEGSFAFQTPSLDNLCLEFSVYPNFGTKTIGRAVALPSLFSCLENNQKFTLPILDHRLHVIGEVDFQVNIITPFEGVTLEVGGDVETYWKSTEIAYPASGTAREPRRLEHHPSSAYTSPAFSISRAGGQPLTVSSLNENYIHVVVQVTRDYQPVVYSDWLLPGSPTELGVADVTRAQFESIATASRRAFDPTVTLGSNDWLVVLSRAMMSLETLLKALPLSVNISLELAYPAKVTQQLFALGRRLSLNKFIDSVLRTITSSVGAPHTRRKIAFFSFSPDVCSALNWKQPNYPVFFASQCGNEDTPMISRAAPESIGDDHRTSSIGAAVEFAKTNNLLGIFVDGDLLVRVPSLIDGIRSAELLVGILGGAGNLVERNADDGCVVDAFICDGTVSFVDRALV